MKYFDLFIEKLMKLGMVICATVVFVVCFIQVISRFVFQFSINWSQDILRLCFIWAVFLGAAYCAKTNEQLNLDVVLSLLPKTTREIVDIMIQTVVAVFCIFLTICGILYAKSGGSQRAPYIPITMAWFFGAVPVSTGLMVLFYTENIIRRVIALIKKPKGGTDA